MASCGMTSAELRIRVPGQTRTALAAGKLPDAIDEQAGLVAFAFVDQRVDFGLDGLERNSVRVAALALREFGVGPVQFAFEVADREVDEQRLALGARLAAAVERGRAPFCRAPHSRWWQQRFL